MKIIIQIILPIILTTVIVLSSLMIKRSSDNRFYYKLSEMNLPIALFLLLIFFFMGADNNIKFMFISIFFLIILFVLTGFTIYLEHQEDGISIKQGFFVKKKFLPYDQIDKVYFEYATDPSNTPQYVFVDNSGNEIEIHSEIEKSEIFFNLLKERGKDDLVLEGVYKKRTVFFILNAIISYILYLIGFLKLFSYILI